MQNKGGRYWHEHTEYDDEPVFYCRSCHSLHIVTDDSLADEFWDGTYCKECCSTDIGQCSMEEWEEEEKRREDMREQIAWSK